MPVNHFARNYFGLPDNSDRSVIILFMPKSSLAAFNYFIGIKSFDSDDREGGNTGEG